MKAKEKQEIVKDALVLTHQNRRNAEEKKENRKQHLSKQKQKQKEKC